MQKWLVGVLAVAAMIVFGTSTAKASTTQLYVTDGTFTTYPPTGFAVGGSLVGVFTTSDGWTVAVSGESNTPMSQPFGLEALTITATCAGGGCLSNPLDVFLSSIDFSEPASGLFSLLTVTAAPSGGTSTQYGYSNNSNGYFDTGTLVGPITVSATGSASATAGASFSSKYSLELEDIFNANGSSGIFTAIGEIGTTPEPATMLLFGTGLFLFGAILRRRLLA